MTEGDKVVRFNAKEFELHIDIEEIKEFIENSENCSMEKWQCETEKELYDAVAERLAWKRLNSIKIGITGKMEMKTYTVTYEGARF